MNDKLWNEVDEYIGQLVEQDDAHATLDEGAKPAIHASPAARQIADVAGAS